MFLSTERGIPLWGAGKRALSTFSEATHTQKHLCAFKQELL